MKKKIPCLLLSLIFAATGFGCSAGDIKVSLDDPMPWGAQEKCVYSVSKIYVGGGEEKEVAFGTYVTEVTTAGEKSSIRNEFNITYNDSDETRTIDETGRFVMNKGLTDSYVGNVEFYRNTLIPIKADKTFELAQRPLYDGAMPERTEYTEGDYLFGYELPGAVKYADPRGYSYTVDYNENKATLTAESFDTVTEDGKYIRKYKKEPHEIALTRNTRFDNEQINYVARACTNMKTKGSATFYLSNIYDSYRRNTYIRYTMNLSCEEKTKNVTLNITPDKFRLTDSEGELDSSGGKYSVKCVQASVRISASTPGPAISMLITDPSVTVTERSSNVSTKKLIVEMTYVEYSPSSAKINYKTVYTLTDYYI